MAKPQKSKLENRKKAINAGINQSFESSRITFSFRYLQMQHEVFNYQDRDSKYFKTVIHRLQAVSDIETKRFTEDQSLRRSIHLHRIDWTTNVSESSFNTGVNGTANPEHDSEAWQFAITVNEHGRVHGFLIGDTFFIVWLDPKHVLYPGNQ